MENAMSDCCFVGYLSKLSYLASFCLKCCLMSKYSMVGLLGWQPDDANVNTTTDYKRVDIETDRRCIYIVVGELKINSSNIHLSIFRLL